MSFTKSLISFFSIALFANFATANSDFFIEDMFLPAAVCSASMNGETVKFSFFLSMASLDEGGDTVKAQLYYDGGADSNSEYPEFENKVIMPDSKASFSEVNGVEKVTYTGSVLGPYGPAPYSLVLDNVEGAQQSQINFEVPVDGEVIKESYTANCKVIDLR